MRAATGPVMSPSTVRRPSMYTPSVVVMPTRAPAILWMCASMRVVVVLPFVPVIAAIGMRVRRARREEHVEHLARHVARLALGGRHVHAEARRRVHLADAAADLVVGCG
jgi:hypothetical protein